MSGSSNCQSFHFFFQPLMLYKEKKAIIAICRSIVPCPCCLRWQISRSLTVMPAAFLLAFFLIPPSMFLAVHAFVQSPHLIFLSGTRHAIIISFKRSQCESHP